MADVPLALPDELTASGDGLVSVIVTFTEALGSRSYEVGTALTGARPGFSYQLAEPSLDVVLSGPVRLLDDLDLAEVSVEVPVSDLGVGDNEVMPNVRTPRGTDVVRVTPSIVRVTVTEAP